MISPGARPFTFWRRLPSWVVPVALIVLVVLVGNAFYVLRLSINDPIAFSAGISHSLCRISCGHSTIDPNVGAITQPLGHLAATDLLHGHLPYWNYYEGLGMPLVGESQSAALFPLVLFFGFSSGLLWFHIALEVLSGVTTYFLARRLKSPILFATIGAMLFSLNGTFAWLANAVINPIAFLPMLLLGIEMILDSAPSANKRGWYVAAIALALSLLAGFPEVAYFDGVFCLAWAVVRLFSVPSEWRLRVVRRLALAAVVGLVLSLPALVPFDDFYKVAYLGGHTATVDGASRLPWSSFATLFDPYIYGTIFTNPNALHIWGAIGGYFTVSVMVLALVGLFGRRLRALRVFLFVYAFLGVSAALNFLEIRKAWNLLPFVATAALTRYIFPSCAMALILLAVFGLEDLVASVVARRRLASASIFMAIIVAWCAYDAKTLNKGVLESPKAGDVLIFLHALPFVALFAFVVLSIFRSTRVTVVLIALVVLGESLVYFALPTGEAPKRLTIDYAPITYLQQHEGEYRFLDMAVLYPNWGTQFHLNELSEIDLPFPKNYAQYIQKNLYPGLSPENQFLIKGGRTGIETQEQNLVHFFSYYEGASVKYLLVPVKISLIPALSKLGVRQVFKDSLATIYTLPHPRPLYSTTSSTCRVTSAVVTSAQVSCSKPTTLVRTELAMKGWRATVNGKSVRVSTLNGVYQEVSLPAGTSTVRFTFVPPHERDAWLLAVLAGLFLLGAYGYEFVPRRRPRHQKETPAT